MGKDSCGTCYAVVKVVAFCQAALSHFVDVDQLLDVGNIQAWVELSEDNVVLNDGRVFLLRTALVPDQRIFADLAAFERCVDECLGIFKIGSQHVSISRTERMIVSFVFVAVSS